MKELQSIYSRTSVKRYSYRPFDNHVIESITKAGLSAPSAMNLRPYTIYVVKNKDILEKIAALSPSKAMLKDASVAMLVVGDFSINPDNNYLQQDCSAVTENILLAAHQLGLGACWLGVNPSKPDFYNALANIINIDEHKLIVSLIAIGYPDGEFLPKPDRYTKNQIITIE